MTRAPTSSVKQWPEKSAHFLHEHLRNVTVGWANSRVSNFDYLLALNCLSGRSFNDLCQYPVFPWGKSYILKQTMPFVSNSNSPIRSTLIIVSVLSNYTPEEMSDLKKKSNYRDLTNPMGALNPEHLKEFQERFETFDDPIIPPFMYGRVTILPVLVLSCTS